MSEQDGYEVSAKQEIMSAAMRNMQKDADISEYAGEIVYSLGLLLDDCDISDGEMDEYTEALVREYVVFVASDDAGIGGSRSDYAAYACVDAVANHCIRLVDDDARRNAVLERLCDSIDEHAVYSDREFDLLRDAGVFGIIASVVLEHSLDSSFIISASYALASKEMGITMSNGTTYVYPDAPYEAYRGLVNAESAGRYYSQYIRGGFGSSDVYSDPLEALRAMQVTPF